MWLDTFYNYTPFALTDADGNKRFSKETHSFSYMYRYWSNYFFERAMRLFEWEGLPFAQKELEQRLLLFGVAGHVPYKDSYMVVNVSMSGVTEYFDKFTDITWATAVNSGTHKIDDTHLLLTNDSLMNGIADIIHFYAILAAHATVTFVDSLVNKRADVIITAADGLESESAVSFLNNLCEGKQVPIRTEQFSNLHITTNSGHSAFVEAWDNLQNIIGQFYETFGIRSKYRKKGNMINEEATMDANLLEININDMFKCRQEIANKLTEVYGHTVTVKCLVDIAEEEVVDNDN